MFHTNVCYGDKRETDMNYVSKVGPSKKK